MKEKKGIWSTGKLVIGIISMVLFLFIILQSCAVGVVNIVSTNDSSSGTLGFFCAAFMLAGGIVSVVSRNNTKSSNGSLAAAILYGIGALCTIGTGDTYGDLIIWGAFCLVGCGLNGYTYYMMNNKEKNTDAYKKRYLSIIIIASICFAILNYSVSISTSSNNTNNGNKTNNNSSYNNHIDDNNDDEREVLEKNKILSFDEKFVFDNLEIVIGSGYSFTYSQSKYSDAYGKNVIKLPISVKNIKTETHSLNQFDYTLFGSNGTEIENYNSDFYIWDDKKDTIDDAGDLRPGAEYTKYIYFEYDGDGIYTIEFDNWSTTKTVEFEIKK